MALYVVGYDLHEGEDYENLIKTLKGYPLWWHCLDSTWIISSDDNTSTIRDNLKKHIKSDDKLLVVTYSRPASWFGFDGECKDWLNKNL